MASRAPTFPPTLSLPKDAEDLLLVIHELVSAGGNPSYQDLADEMGLHLDQVRVLVRFLEATGRIAVPADAGKPIRVVHPPAMPDFEAEISLGDWELGVTDWQICEKDG